MSFTPTATPTANSPASTAGSPFVVGRALQTDERIFGRALVLRGIGEILRGRNSVNLVGERRMGKTSVLNHLRGHPANYLTMPAGKPPFLVVVLDLQGQLDTPRKFYGAAWRGILDALPPSPERKKQLEKLRRQPEADAGALEDFLKELRAANRARPLLLVDEFEKLFEAPIKDSFPLPGFYDGLRHFQTADLWQIVIATRRPLAEYFSGPTGALSSTFPTYFQPQTLERLSIDEAHQLLLQESRYPLSVAEAEEAWHWAQGHPCHLQAAGHAYYDTKAQQRTSEWRGKRREELKKQCCMVNEQPSYLPPPVSKWQRWRLGTIVLLFVLAVWLRLPPKIGEWVQQAGEKFDQIAAWVIGLAVLLTVALLILGVAPRSWLRQAIAKAFGFAEGETPDKKN